MTHFEGKIYRTVYRFTLFIPPYRKANFSYAERTSFLFWDSLWTREIQTCSFYALHRCCLQLLKGLIAKRCWDNGLLPLCSPTHPASPLLVRPSASTAVKHGKASILFLHQKDSFMEFAADEQTVHSHLKQRKTTLSISNKLLFEENKTDGCFYPLSCMVPSQWKSVQWEQIQVFLLICCSQPQSRTSIQASITGMALLATCSTHLCFPHLMDLICLKRSWDLHLCLCPDPWISYGSLGTQNEVAVQRDLPPYR